MGSESSKNIREVLSRVKTKKAAPNSEIFLDQPGDKSLISKEFREGSYAVLYIHTTGKSPQTDQIDEIFVLRYRQGKQEDSFHRFIKPFSQGGKAERAHDRFPEEAFGGLDEVLTEFCAFVKTDVLVGHLVFRDIKFIRNGCQKCGLPIPENYALSTKVLAKKLIKDVESTKLQALASYYFIPLNKDVPYAEGITLLVLAIFKEIIVLLEKKDLARIIEALRLQGDFESCFRMGWGISQETLGSLPQSPGVAYFMDQFKRLTLVCSFDNLHDGISQLSDLKKHTRPLIAQLLKSCDIATEVAASPFAAALMEANDNRISKLPVDPKVIHRRFPLFVAIVKKKQGGTLVVRSACDGMLVGIGPFKDKVVATAVLKKLVKHLRLEIKENQVPLSLQQTTLLARYISDTWVPGWEGKDSLVRSSFPISKNQKLQWDHLRSLKWSEEIKTNLHLTGVLLVPEKSEDTRSGFTARLGLARRVYIVLGGVPYEQFLTKDFEHEVLKKNDAVGDLLKKTLEKGSQVLGKPLTAKQSRLINKVSWWLFYAEKQGLSFYPIQDLLSHYESFSSRLEKGIKKIVRGSH